MTYMCYTDKLLTVSFLSLFLLLSHISLVSDACGCLSLRESAVPAHLIEECLGNKMKVNVIDRQTESQARLKDSRQTERKKGSRMK